MLFTLGLLLLLTPFPSFQSPTNERRDSAGSDVTKPNAVFTLSKPKTTVALAKQTARPTLKPNTVNQMSLSTPATAKNKPAPAVIQTNAAAASGTITNKDKHTASSNQTVSARFPSTKDKPALTGTPNVQSVSTKSASASGAKITKDKLQPAANQTVSIKSPSTRPKDKPSVQNVQTTSLKSAPASGTKTTKNKPMASVNQTVVAKSPSTADVKNSKGNQTTISKDKPTPSQPIKVVISDGCDSSNTKEQELKLKPGAPLVMTHKISLLPGGCTGGCESEMTALKERVARLEREMTSLKDKCIIPSCSPDYYI